MNNRPLFEKYTRSWRFFEDGSKQAKNDLAGVRRTRTALQKMLTSDFEEVLQPEHVLALRAAANVLTELDSSMEKLPRLLDAEQKRRQIKHGQDQLAAIDAYISTNAADEWFQNDPVAEAENALLDTFEGAEGKEWLMTFKSVEGSHGAEPSYRGLRIPDFACTTLTPRQRLAVRLSKIAATGKVEASTYGERGRYACWGLEDFRAWKAWRSQVAGAINKAIAKA